MGTNTEIIQHKKDKKDMLEVCRKKKHFNVKNEVNVTNCAQAGAPLISISQTLKLSSNMKSNPNSWKLW